MKNLTLCLLVIFFLTGCTKKDDFTVPVWHCLEIPFTAEKAYNNPLDGTELCEMDVVFTHSDGTKICRPAFWDGENIFKVRFAPTKPGRWQYRTVCEQERSLNSIKGSIKAVEYDGVLDIYKHGFLTISDNKRYFTYNDGKPFFYLGDTHWSLPFEAFESSNVPGIPSQFKHIVDTRIEQGFTVFQSEPIQWENHTGQDAIYDLTAFGPEVLGGFANLDRKFKYLADKGMVHANAQLFFANELGVKMDKYPNAYIEALTRYWIARYGAYPVMWTCAQEVDNDFYFDRENDQRNFDAENNPWKIVAKSLYKYDAYHHPLTAHMEYASGEALNDGHGTIATNSSFKNIEGHNWYACQWSPTKKGQLDFRVPKDFWNSRPVKPTVNYEGHYDHFWTNTLGARMQGWTAYLNGMFGYGYGSAGIWLIINSYPDDLAGAYDLHRDTDAEITKEVKRMPWNESLVLPAAEQVGKHMRQFFESLEWWNLTPRFDDAEWSDLKDAYYSLATIGNNVYVCYFYNPGTVTGSLKNLSPGKSYTAQWFDPQNGQYRRIGIITSDSDGVWEIPAKPSDDDWVLLLKLQNQPTSKMEWIGLSADGKKLVEVSTGKTFQMWGVNYDRDYKLRLMDDYWFKDWDTVLEDFDEMKEMGLNVVRIHLQFGRFMDTPTQPNMQALNQLTKLIRESEEREMYLYVTGLGCYKKQNIPDWYEAMDEHERTAVQATFWKHLARVCASSPAVLCYDLMNEPIVSAGPVDDWVTGGIDELYYVQNLAKTLNGRTPQEIAKPWVDKLVAAIRAEDNRHLITVGAIPLELYETVWPDVKPLFNDPVVCENLDFISVHFYPEKGEVSKALHVLSLYDIGKPIVIAETFPINCSFEEMDQFIEASKSITQGWFSFYWGKTIEEYAQEDNIGSAIMKQWLEYYREKGKSMNFPR